VFAHPLLHRKDETTIQPELLGAAESHNLD
jgi:hypothetical protein